MEISFPPLNCSKHCPKGAVEGNFKEKLNKGLGKIRERNTKKWKGKKEPECERAVGRINTGDSSGYDSYVGRELAQQSMPYSEQRIGWV